MRAWEEFMPDVLPEVPGCPEIEAEHAIKRAAQEFFKTTHVWRLWLDDVTTLADEIEYDIELEPESNLVRTMRATLDGREILCTTTAALPADWKTNTSGIRDCIHTVDRTTLILLPPPAADLILKVEASLSPSDHAGGVDDTVFDNHAEDIARGALARLMTKTGRPFTNPFAGQAKRKEFEDAMNVLAIQVQRGFSSTLPRARGRFY